MYSVVYFANRREVSVAAASWQRAMDKASNVAITKAKPFPIVIKDDCGTIIHKISG